MSAGHSLNSSHMNSFTETFTPYVFANVDDSVMVTVDGVVNHSELYSPKITFAVLSIMSVNRVTEYNRHRHRYIICQREEQHEKDMVDRGNDNEGPSNVLCVCPKTTGPSPDAAGK